MKRMRPFLTFVLACCTFFPAAAEECRIPSIAKVVFELPEGFELASAPRSNETFSPTWVFKRGESAVQISMSAWKENETPLAKLDARALFNKHYETQKKSKHVSELKKLSSKEKARHKVKYGMKLLSSASWGAGPQLNLYSDRCFMVLQVQGPEPKPTFDALLPTVRMVSEK